MTDVRIIFHDTAPDKHGQRFYTLTWYEADGVFRPEPQNAPQRGPVGFRRGQCFRCNPSRHLELVAKQERPTERLS